MVCNLGDVQHFDRRWVYHAGKNGKAVGQMPLFTVTAGAASMGHFSGPPSSLPRCNGGGMAEN